MMSSMENNGPNYLPSQGRCTGDALIEMAQITKTFKNAAGKFTALKNMTACFYPGEFVSVVGKSGSGKSTLVNMITGIDHPTSGTVRVGDTYVHTLSESDMSVWRGKNLGIVFQFFQLLPTLSLLENVMLPMYLGGGFTPAQREQRALNLLKLVGLEGLENKLPAAVAGGQQQCAAIARALANDPPILIADEPTGNLDPRTAEDVFDLFARLIDHGKTILMVTHDISLAGRTTRTLLLSDGELINPWIASALPDLGHSQMLWLTHHLQPRLIQPGFTLPGIDASADWLIFVTAGYLEPLGYPGDPGAQARSRLGPGSFISSLNLPKDGVGRPALNLGSDEPVELLVVEGPELEGWLSQNPANRLALEGVEWRSDQAALEVASHGSSGLNT
jgi:putative ABC transport system ATP-binding protein